MPVRFGHVPRPEARPVLQYRVDKPLFIVAGSDTSFDRETPIHWLPDLDRGVPCTHEDCPWCVAHNPTRTIVYVPCQCFSTERRCWFEAVAPINEGMQDFLKQPRSKIVYQFVRRNYRNATVKWFKCEREKWSNEFSGFDVEPSLFKMWGMYGKARKTADRPGEDKPRLFDEPPAANAG